MKYSDFGRRSWAVVLRDPSAYMGSCTVVVVAESIADAIASIEKHLKNDGLKADILEVKDHGFRVI